MARKVVVLGFEGYQELHVWYPVLRFREEQDEVVLAGPDGVDAVFGSLAYPLAPQASVGDVDASGVDLVIVPGGPGAAQAAKDDSLTGFLERAAAAGATLACVGEGAQLAESAGLRPPSSDALVAVDGNVVTVADSDALPELCRHLTN